MARRRLPQAVRIDFSGELGYLEGSGPCPEPVCESRIEPKEVPMLGSIGPTELILILLIVIIIFGARKLPDLGKSIGEGIKNFKKSMNTKDDPDNPKKPDPPAG
jgi:sec-independent protein translocase protein TatA